MYSHSLHRLVSRSRIQELNTSTGLFINNISIVVIGRDIVNSNTSQWCFHIESTVSSTGDGIARHSVIVGQCTVRSDSQQQTVRSGLAISGGIKYGGFYIIFIGCTGNIKYEIVERLRCASGNKEGVPSKLTDTVSVPKHPVATLTPRRLPQSLPNRGQARQMSLYALPQQQK